MERNVRRINGIKTDLGRLSDDELENHMQYAHERIGRATDDLDILGQESARRFDAAEQVGEVSLATVIELFPQETIPGLDGGQPA